MIEQLDFTDIKNHYEERNDVHRELLNFFLAQNIENYVRLALGISDPRGNYSSSEYSQGPSILSENNPNAIFRLAQEIYNCEKTSHIPDIIHRRNIQYLKISIGSEMGMMLKPNQLWVGNARTIWAHLLIKHNWNINRANEELELYRDNERDSEMNYRIWRDIYLSLESSLNEIIIKAEVSAKGQGIEMGTLKFLWADAIASNLYNQR